MPGLLYTSTYYSICMWPHLSATNKFGLYRQLSLSYTQNCCIDDLIYLFLVADWSAGARLRFCTALQSSAILCGSTWFKEVQ